MTEEINDTSSLDTRIGTVLMKMKDRKNKRRKRTGNKEKNCIGLIGMILKLTEIRNTFRRIHH